MVTCEFLFTQKHLAGSTETDTAEPTESPVKNRQPCAAMLCLKATFVLLFRFCCYKSACNLIFLNQSVMSEELAM